MAVPKAPPLLRSLLNLEHQAVMFRWRAVRLLFLVLAIAAVVAQQHSLLILKASPNDFYRNVLNLGASYQRYFSFYYYFGGFPVNLDRLKTSTLDETKATLAQEGPRLRTDLNVYNRASVFLFYPDTWLKGRPDTAEMRTGLALWFTAGLLSVVVALWYVGMPILGLVVALLCGSNPFQVFELYHRGSSTIFPTVIATGLVITGMALLLSSTRFQQCRRLSLLLVSVSAIICALQYEIRLEGVGVFFGAAFGMACLSPQSIRRRLGYACIFVVLVVTTSMGLNAYFDASLARADRIVESHGGTPAKTTNAYYSTQWWALWSGLGDFDEKYGFLVDDRAGISFYYGHDTSVMSEQAMRAHYLETVRRDPAWWADIVIRRLKRVMIENTPYRIGYGTWHTDLPLSPTLLTTVGLALFAASLWAWQTTVLTLFVLPFSIGLVSVGQLADYGLQFYGVVHLFILGYVACFALDCAVGLVAWGAATFRRRVQPPNPS